MPDIAGCQAAGTAGAEAVPRRGAGGAGARGARARLAAAVALLGATAAFAAGLAGAPQAAAAGALIVVATDGSDAGAGTVDDPLATVQEAVDRAGPGDTIAVRGGTYALTDNITITTSGEPGNPITLGPYGDEHVVIDGEQLPASHTPVGGSIPSQERGAIHQEASHWRIEGLEIIRGPYGVYCDDCDDNAFSGLTTRDNYETGFQLQGDSGGNLISGLDSYGNHDPRKNGESADGLGVKEGSGEGNRVVGARLWNNADDGFDAWEFLSAITVEDSVAFGNGVNRWDFPDFTGDGNGFKMGGGGEDLPADHVLRNVLAFGNAVDGVTDNGNPGTLAVSRCTTYRNGGTGFDVDASASELTANLSVLDAEAPVSLGGSHSVGNSWDLGGDWDEDSVLSTDPATLTGPRAADGSIPSSDFLVPRDGSAIGARF
ncbi:right-handed parallel beta-helix repeat-containing protein [Streptomyces hoynatensis]|uniref:Pectate lyase n=1 Tax=Streptomyces hoynatensis TaxID=1141874 RepID=A0A3A9YUX6_9ACTN|nr:right-handed parallel beta-helix repeat-containing protein [Streptomyces hoynatensis]RKN39027.1 pectate lyase [Streptomyces hoynatensis]